MILKGIRAILFDLNGTLAYVDDPISYVDLSDLLFSRGYEISPQQLNAACFLVSMVDYPRYGYRSWKSYLSQVFRRLGIKVDKKTLDHVIKLLTSKPYKLYPDTVDTVVKGQEKRV